jgi:hypothetical protein
MMIAQDPISFIIKMEKGERGHDSGETERESEGECECRWREEVASVVKWTVRKYMCTIN